MKNLRIRGLRSLVDTGPIRIAPITVLLGENSSGKSTFLRTFPLLRQSVEVRTSEPLLWYGRLVDFGSFDESVSKFAEKKAVELELLIDLDATTGQFRHTLPEGEAIPCKVTLTVVDGPKDASTPGEKKVASFVQRLQLELWDVKVDLLLSSPTEIEQLLINGEDCSVTAKATYSVMKTLSPAPTLYQIRDDIEEVDLEGPHLSTFDELLHVHVKNLVHNRTKDDSIDNLTNLVRLGPASAMLAWVQSTQAHHGVWRKQVASWSEDTTDFVLLRQLVWASRLEQVLDGESRR